LQKNTKNEKTEKELNNYVNIIENIEIKIKENKFKEIVDENKQILFNYLDNEKNKEILKDILGEKNFKKLYIEYRDFIYDEENKLYNDNDEVVSNDCNKNEIINLNFNISEIRKENKSEDNFLSEKIFDSQNDIHSFINLSKTIREKSISQDNTLRENSISSISPTNSYEANLFSLSSFNDGQ